MSKLHFILWIQESLHHLKNHPLTYVFFLITLFSYCLLIQSIAFISYGGYQRYLEWQQGMQLELFLSDSTSEKEKTQIIEYLTAQPIVDSVSFISPDQAMQTLNEILGWNVMDFTETNPLPASIRIVLAPFFFKQADINKFISELKQFQGVQGEFKDFIFYSHWYKLFRTLLMGSCILLLALLITSLFTITALCYYNLQNSQTTLRFYRINGLSLFTFAFPYWCELVFITAFCSFSAYRFILFFVQELQQSVYSGFLPLSAFALFLIYAVLPFPIALKILNTQSSEQITL